MATTLFYIHDPMCSWCNAFESSLTALQKELPDFNSNEIEQELQHEISKARSLGVNSYSSLRLEHNGGIFPVSVDYLDHETMVNEILGILGACPRT
jgi:protein-disulfide isomerase-like protein with CxxC motif